MNILEPLISAVTALGGVWLGGHLTSKREASRERERVEKEASYLSIIVVAQLDRFLNGCVDVAFDDGTSEGRPAGRDGTSHETTVQTPTFAPLDLDVDWKVLPAELMYGILNLPHQIEQLAHRVARAEDVSSAPDYAELFWTRQGGYALLGLEVSALAQRLRAHARLPPDKPADDEWNRDRALRQLADEVAQAKAAHEARIAAAPAI